MQIKRPFGVNVVFSYYIAVIIIFSEETFVRLDHRWYRFIVDGSKQRIG